MGEKNLITTSQELDLANLIRYAVLHAENMQLFSGILHFFSLQFGDKVSPETQIIKRTITYFQEAPYFQVDKNDTGNDKGKEEEGEEKKEEKDEKEEEEDKQQSSSSNLLIALASSTIVTKLPEGSSNDYQICAIECVQALLISVRNRIHDESYFKHFDKATDRGNSRAILEKLFSSVGSREENTKNAWHELSTFTQLKFKSFQSEEDPELAEAESALFHQEDNSNFNALEKVLPCLFSQYTTSQFRSNNLYFDITDFVVQLLNQEFYECAEIVIYYCCNVIAFSQPYLVQEFPKNRSASLFGLLQDDCKISLNQIVKEYPEKNIILNKVINVANHRKDQTSMRLITRGSESFAGFPSLSKKLHGRDQSLEFNKKREANEQERKEQVKRQSVIDGFKKIITESGSSSSSSSAPQELNSFEQTLRAAFKDIDVSSRDTTQYCMDIFKELYLLITKDNMASIVKALCFAIHDVINDSPKEGTQQLLVQLFYLFSLHKDADIFYETVCQEQYEGLVDESAASSRPKAASSASVRVSPATHSEPRRHVTHSVNNLNSLSNQEAAQDKPKQTINRAVRCVKNQYVNLVDFAILEIQIAKANVEIAKSSEDADQKWHFYINDFNDRYQSQLRQCRADGFEVFLNTGYELLYELRLTASDALLSKSASPEVGTNRSTLLPPPSSSSSSSEQADEQSKSPPEENDSKKGEATTMNM